MSNIPITQGTGSASVAAETVGGISFQQVEIYGAGGSSILGINPDRSINVSVIGIPAVSISGNPSISGTVNVGGSVAVAIVSGSIATAAVANQSVSGTVQIAGIGGSIATVHSVDDQIAASMLALVTDTVIHGRTAAGGGTYVEVKVDPSGALVTTAGSVVTFQGGTQITSVVNSIPSSLLAGASIFGQLPAGTAPIGSVATLQGTNPWVTLNTGSVITVTQGSVATRDTITSIATANGGLPLWSPLPSRIQGTADFRGNSGASIAVVGAAGAGVRNYVDHVQILNFGSASVLVTIADNTTSILGYTIAPAGGGSNYDTFYRGAANSPITASINGVASVLVSMQGFTSST